MSDAVLHNYATYIKRIQILMGRRGDIFTLITSLTLLSFHPLLISVVAFSRGSKIEDCVFLTGHDLQL